MTTFPRREKFDANRDYVVRKPLLYAGHAFAFGDRFDKRLAPTRRLRQLYDARKLDMLPQELAPPPKRVDLNAMSKAELTTWLIAHDVIPRPSASRDRLVEKARQVLEQRAPQ